MSDMDAYSLLVLQSHSLRLGRGLNPLMPKELPKW